MSIDLKPLVRSIPDYPKKGILFRDITTLIENPAGFRASVEQLAEAHRGLGITHVAGIEARGFIFGAGTAIALGVGFVPVRKKGNSPARPSARTTRSNTGWTPSRSTPTCSTPTTRCCW